MTELSAGSSASTVIYQGPGGKPVLAVAAAPGAAGAGQAEINAALQQQVTGGQVTPVSGVGDAAALVQSSSAAGIAFIKGNTIVVIAVSQESAGQVDASKLTDLAKSAADKL